MKFCLYLKETSLGFPVWYHKMDKDSVSVWTNIQSQAKEFSNSKVVHYLIQHLQSTEAGYSQEFFISVKPQENV